MPNNYLRYSVIGLLFVIPFVGLYVSSTLFFPYITGKNLLFRGLIEVAFALYVILALRAPAYRPRLHTVFLSFALFIAVIFVADIFGIYPFKSFWSNFERMEGFITHLHLFAYFIMMSTLFTGEKIWTRYFQTSLAASLIVGLVGLKEIAAGGVRVSATLGNSTYLGIYMLFHIFIAGFLLVRIIERKGIASTKWWKGIAYAATILFDFYIFYNTGTRGALLGLIAGALFTALAFAIWEKNKGLKWLGIGVLASILLVVALLASFKDSAFISHNPLLSRFAALATFDKTELEKFATTQGKSRFGIWDIAYQGFKERPILGWGQDNFNYVFNEHYDPKIYDQEQWFDRAHNVFFDWLIAGGLLGLLSYLSLFVTAIIAIWRSRAHEKDLYFLFSDKVLLTALLIAYFVHNLFVFDNLTSYLVFFMILAFVGIHDRKSIKFSWLEKPIKDESYTLAGGALAIVVGCVSLYYFTFAPYISGSALISALSYATYANTHGDSNALQTSLDSFTTALSYNNIVGIQEAREQFLQSTSEVLFTNGISSDIKGAFFAKAQAEMQTEFDTVPPDARNYLLYGSFLDKVGKAASSTELQAQGINDLLTAAKLSPNKQTILFEIGSVYLNNGEYAKAVPVFKQAFESEPAYSEARFLYALSLVYTNDLTTADMILAPLQNTSYLGDVRLVRAYFEIKNKARLEQTLRYKLTYAGILASSGDKTGAIAEINQAISISPALLKKEGDAMIAQINSTK